MSTISRSVKQWCSTDFCLLFSRSLQFLKKSLAIALYRRFYRNSSTGKAENSSAEGKPRIFVEFGAPDEIL